MKHSIRLWAAVALMSLPALLAGCGKKGPPVPPRQKPPPPVEELSHRIDDDRLTLYWRVPTTNRSGYDAPAGYRVLRNRQPLPQVCPRCPMAFETAAELPLSGPERQDRDPGSLMTYTEALEAGYFYTYKVVAVSGKGIASGESRFIGFEFPETTTREE